MASGAFVEAFRKIATKNREREQEVLNFHRRMMKEHDLSAQEVEDANKHGVIWSGLRVENMLFSDGWKSVIVPVNYQSARGTRP